MDPFIHEPNHYRRRINLLSDYIRDSALYLSKMTDAPIEETTAFVTQSLKEGKLKAKMPGVVYLQKDKNGDRKVNRTSFHGYLQSTIDSGNIMAPTMTTYLPPSARESLLARFIEGNVKLRSASKKAKFQATMNKLTELAKMYDAQQNTFKIKNNALSGAQSSAFTPLWNKTGHSTLTSICRAATSYANANNEKFLYGNRHYYSPDIVKANIISIIGHSDMAAIEAAMKDYNLLPPTVDHVMACIERSTNAYWRSKSQMALIRMLVEKLSPWELSAFLFTSDLYHLAQVNPEFVRGMLLDLSVKTLEPISFDEAKTVLGMVDDNMTSFVAILCAKELKGKDIGALLKRIEAGDEEAKLDYCVVGANAQHKYQVIEKYGSFINAFWATDNLPSSVFALPSIVRRGVLTSDTDSTIFTVQNWVHWLYGKIDFSDNAVATANGIVYLTGQLVRHILATLCGNMGVEPKNVFGLRMKNEYYFPVFVLTTRAKHYWAYRAAQEGLVFDIMQKEIKGVGLRSSAISSQIINLSQEMMFDLIDVIMRGDKIKLTYYVRKVATIEREVISQVSSGSFEYFRRDSIKDKSSYKSETSKYIYYDLWQTVFAPKYGEAPEPPFMAVKASLKTGNRGVFQEWLKSLEDQALAERFRDWVAKNNKDSVSTMYMPTINLIAKGVPVEIAQAIDVRSLVGELMESFYLVLECMGIYARNGNNTRFLSDDETILSLPEGVLNLKEPSTETA